MVTNRPRGIGIFAPENPLYSLAISPIDALDLSRKSLQTAGDGIYSQKPFREGLTARDGRTVVCFSRGNLRSIAMWQRLPQAMTPRSFV
jgi:chemotaxis methyl-accepting protein methylase